MDKTYDHKKYEVEIYKMWEKGGYFKPEINPKGKPYTIVLPPPNASGKMHTGNVLMIAIEDLLIRLHRMKGYAALWLPGTDHAGTETQITFERELKKEGKSRFSYSRKDLYDAIWEFVQNNKGQIEAQIKQMGASIDWDRYTFTLDDKVINTVHDTFKKMAKDGLVYRGNYIVNYCTKCGTTYSDVELKHEERKDPLFYMKYGPFVLATVRPETKFGDTAVAVNPKDSRYKEWIGKEIEVDGLMGKLKLKVIADEFVDPKFGTGVVKVTPAHDKNDYDAGIRHNLEVKQVIGLDGKLNDKCGKYSGLNVNEARKLVVNDLKQAGLMEIIDEDYIHTVVLCKAGHEIEPMVLPNWFIKVNDNNKSFKKPAGEAVTKNEVKIYPNWQKIKFTRWIEDMRDWPISRQNVWGIQIPVQYEIDDSNNFFVWFIDQKNKLHQGRLREILDSGFSLDEIKKGLQKVLAFENSKWKIDGETDANKQYLPETDTFDTWFSSGHWPLVTLGYPNSQEFKKFYPTNVLETGWEILRLWVSRMIMFGFYLTNKPPFKEVYLHGIVRALDGRKMSKSLGNVVNPDEYIENYGVDALRMGLISGTANGKDFAFPKDKVVAFRNFSNKVWNMGRFFSLMAEELDSPIPDLDLSSKKNFEVDDKLIIKNFNTTVNKVNSSLEKYRFSDAADAVYHFMWDQLAAIYLENIKKRDDKKTGLSVFKYVYFECLKLLHPFMPFVTEAVWLELKKYRNDPNVPLIISNWPVNKNQKS